MKRILVTGAAGFIGYHLSKRLVDLGFEVTGVDNLNDYYDVNLKRDRLRQIGHSEKFTFLRLDLSHKDSIESVFQSGQFDAVVNLAAQAGVRYSLEKPHDYVQSNVAGFLNILEGCRHSGVGHLVFASSSSVYGANTKMPFSVHDNVDHPVSLYAATKKANELMAHSYASLYALPCTGLRFFTVYGPWGRPDMAYFIFTKALLEGRVIDVYNSGEMKRDFTYIDDVVEGILKVLPKTARPDKAWDSDVADPATSYAPYRLYNIGNHKSVDLMEFINTLEGCLGIKARLNFRPMQPGDVKATYADVEDSRRHIGYNPSTSLGDGLRKFVDWFREYYGGERN